MADEPTNDDSTQEEGADFGAFGDGGGEDSSDDDSFGMGSLPPLSDFDSTEPASDSDLPPLDTPEEEKKPGSIDESPISGLPPIVDIKVDTPAVRPSDLDTPEPSKGDQETPTPMGFETPASELDSPETGGMGFQDFAADSDFSPETPEIGPGPDSDIETPMFDSAFGGDSDDFSTSATSTPAPTQAMETPMFGSQPGMDDATPGFDQGAFGLTTPQAGLDTGTPVPDFSPDTGAGVIPEPGMTPAAMAPRARRGGGVIGVLVTLVVGIVMLVAGVFVGPMIAGTVPFVPDPAARVTEDKDKDIAVLNTRIAQLVRATEEIDTQLSQDEVDKMIEDYQLYRKRLTDIEAALEGKQSEIERLENSRMLISADIDQKNEQFIDAQDLLEDLENEHRITDAKHKGLLAENNRLTEMVDELEIANARRQATKDTLLHNIDLLTVQIQGGSPLTPERFNYADRLARVNALRDKVARGKWVDPQLLDEYTGLYLAELGIGTSREYFFARIPVHNSLGDIEYIWAECLMNGNWSVYFSTIKGNHVGSYENTAGSGPPRYEFREDLPGSIRTDIVQAIRASRVEDYEDKIKVLREKGKIYQTKSPLQEKFSSL